MPTYGYETMHRLRSTSNIPVPGTSNLVLPRSVPVLELQPCLQIKNIMHIGSRVSTLSGTGFYIYDNFWIKTMINVSYNYDHAVNFY